jgi:DNA-binding transcriptional LysR family regulator
MEVKQLKHFLAVVETGSFHKAAARVNVTQQAISRSIQRLERECGGRLLERKRGDRRQVGPSPFGVLLIPRAKRVLGEIEDFRGELDNLVGQGHDVVRVGVAPAAERILIHGVVRVFRERHPGVRVQVVRAVSHRVIEQLAAGLYEIGVCDEPEDKLGAPFIGEALYRDRNVFVAGRGHPLLQRGRLSLQDLDGGPWLILGPFCRMWNELRDMYAAQGIKPARHDVETNSVEVALRHLVHDAFVGYLPARLVAPELAAGVLVRLPVRQPRPRAWDCLLVRRADSMMNVATRTFADVIRAEARRLGRL